MEPDIITNETNISAPRDFLNGTFGMEKANKSTELGPSMSIVPNAPDEFTNKQNSLTGGSN